MKNSTSIKLSAALLWAAFTCSPATAQVSFYNGNAVLSGNGSGYRSGCAMTVTDVNFDGLDDLVRLNQSNTLMIDLQNLDGTFTQHAFGQMGTSAAWAMAVADFDHNGYKDVVAGKGSSGFIAMITNPGGTLTATITQMTGGNYFWQNISICDMNNDGWEDIFGCDDVNWSKLFINNGNGTFRRMANSLDSMDISTGIKNFTVQSGLAFTPGQNVYVTYSGQNYMTGEVLAYNSSNGAMSVDVTATVGSGSFKGWSVDENTVVNFITHPGSLYGGDPNNSGNYGTVWTDFDQDNDMDFYIAKCRQSSSNPNDLRRIDQLFINDGTYKFTEMAASVGLAIGWQTWTASFGDVDNDGDFDMAAVNNDHQTQLMENDGNNMFTEIASPGISTTGIYPIESQFEDFDNDGFVDFIVSGDDDIYYYHNNGNKTFTLIDPVFASSGILSFATGDLNHDGWIDVFASFGNLYNSPSGSTDDIIYINNKNSFNHYINFNLEGTISNKTAVGARIKLYGSWGVQTREVRSGESYGTVNTQMLHFGIGTQTSADSAVIYWPSGTVTHIGALAADQFVTVIEGNCVVSGNIVPGPFNMCSGQTITLNAASGFSSYTWNDGSTNQSLVVDTTGVFNVTVTDANGCSNTSPSYNVQLNPDETPSILVAGETTFCEGSTVTLTSSAAGSYQWSNGSTSQSIQASASGSYTVTIQGACMPYTSAPVAVTMLDAPAPAANGTSINSPQSVTLNATGNNLTWYDAATGGNVLGTGSSYVTPVISTTTTFYVEDMYSYPGDTIFGARKYFGGSTNTYNNTVAGALIFDVSAPCVLNSVKVYTDSAAVRTIELRNSGGTVLESMSINILPDTSRITLNFPLTPGTGYYLTTNSDTNNTNFGYVSPRLRRNSQGASFPYPVGNLVSITSGHTGTSPTTNAYYYFYDWEVTEGAEECVSSRTPVTVDVITGLNNTSGNTFNVYPNPAEDLLFITAGHTVSGQVSVDVFDLTGRVVKNFSWNGINAGTTQTTDLSALAKGTYTLRIHTAEGNSTHRVVLR